ncbi:MAG: ComF family protein [Clostridiales bacterium]|nr:ComF family protein [Clostridiales bacterium]
MILKKLLELLFPSNIYCISCGSIIDSSRAYSLCDSCMRLFHWANGRTCEKCGKIIQESYPHEACSDCREHNHYFKKGYSCVQYGIYERDLLLAFKYGGKTYIGEKIADAMADRLRAENIEVDFTTAVPMHGKKKEKRGFNQAEIIASRLAPKLPAPYAGRVLVRTGNTVAMSRLSAEERRMNMENAFSMARGAEKMVAGKKVLLVDDIYTTGSTVDACSRVLLAAGAAEVRVITFAAGANLLRNVNAAAQVCG